MALRCRVVAFIAPCPSQLAPRRIHFDARGGPRLETLLRRPARLFSQVGGGFREVHHSLGGQGPAEGLAHLRSEFLRSCAPERFAPGYLEAPYPFSVRWRSPSVYHH